MNGFPCPTRQASTWASTVIWWRTIAFLLKRDEFPRTLWGIMKGFVDNAWDVRLIPAFLPEIFDDASGADEREVESYDEEAIDDEA